MKVYCDRCGARNNSASVLGELKEVGVDFIRCVSCCNWGARLNPLAINGVKLKPIYSIKEQ